MSGSNNNSNGVIFLSTVLSKMSQLFTDINSTYLHAMLNKESVNAPPAINFQTLFSQLQKECKEKIPNLIQEAHQDEQKHTQNELDKAISSSRKKTKDKKEEGPKTEDFKGKKEKEVTIQPPHPPPSSYLLFFKEHRQKIANQFPNLGVTDLSKIASKCWKQLTVEEKQPYNQQFNKEKEKYYEALKVYNLSIGKAEPAPLKRKTKKQKTDQPLNNKTENMKKAVVQKQVPKYINPDDQDSNFDSSLQI